MAMKWMGLNIWISFAFVFVSQVSWAQDTTTYFLNSKKEIVTGQPYSYTRKLFQEGDLWRIIDYWANGAVEMTGTFASKEMLKEEGVFISYHENGVVESEMVFLHGKIQGDVTGYDDQGNKRDHISYNTNGDREGLYETWFESGELYGQGRFENDKHIGEWQWYWPSGQRSALEVYDDRDEIKRVTYWNEDGTELPEGESGDYMPEYKGRYKSVAKFLRRNIVYPRKCKRQNITGKVFVKFVVTDSGEVENIKVLRGVHPLIDKEAVRVLRKMDQWIPGKVHNQKVNIWYVLPINFRLN